MASTKDITLQTRLTLEQKQLIEKAAKLRNMAISDYVRLLVAMAKREVESARSNVLELTADEQLEFWNALNAPVKLTPAQRRLSRLMRGKA